MRWNMRSISRLGLALGLLGGAAAGPLAAQTRSTPNSTQVVGTMNIWADDLDAIIAALRVHHGNKVQPAATISGYAFTPSAGAAIVAAGMVPASALAAVRSDMVLTEMLVRVAESAKALGANAAPADMVNRLAARLAPLAAPAANSTERDTSFILARRALNDRTAKEAGVGAAAAAAGGVKNLLDTAAAVQAVGGDANPKDPAFIAELRNSGREQIVARTAATGVGLPPDLANRHAQDILRDVATLQEFGGGTDLRDPEVQTDLRRMGWRPFILRQALRGVGLPDDAVISSDPSEILRRASKIQGLGGFSGDPASYDVLRLLEGGRISEGTARQRLADVAARNPGWMAASAEVDAAISWANARRSGSAATPGTASTPTAPGSSSGSGGSGSGSGGTRGGTPEGSRPPTPPASNSNPAPSSSTPPAEGDNGGDSQQPMGDGNVDMVVRITHNSDGSYTAEAMGCNGDGNCESYGSERFTDADGDGDYEGDKGGSSTSKPDEGDHAGDLDDDGNGVDYGYEEDDSGDDSAADDSADPPADDNSAGYTSPESRQFLGAMMNYSTVMLVANAQGNMTALWAGDFRVGTGNSTPTPDGGTFYTRPTGDVPIRDLLSNPGQRSAPRPAAPPAPTAPRVNEGQINPAPDSTTGGPPVQLPVQTAPRPVPGVGGSIPSPTPQR